MSDTRTQRHKQYLATVAWEKKDNSNWEINPPYVLLLLTFAVELE